MKKISFASLMLAVFLGSCSNDSVPVVEQEVEGGDLVPISLGLNMGQADVSVTRGTGTVGGTTDAENVWNYENLYVLMTSSDDEALEDPNAEWGFTSVKGQVLKEQFDNSFFARPKSVDRNGSPVWTLDYQCDPNEGGNLKYYPTQGESDFFAYHVDDAATVVDAKGNPEIQMSNNAITVDITMDGSQDLLTGKADVATIPSNLDANGFSAKTARANVIPNIKMEHKLSRLTFTLKNGNAMTAGVTVKSISVESKYKGTMTVAAKDNSAELGVNFVDEYTRLYLKEKMDPTAPGYFVNSLSQGKCPLVDFTPIVMDGATDVEAGEALFICPGDKEYKLNIQVEYAIENNGVPTIEPKDIPVTFQHPDKTSAFEAGKSYHLNVTIYGLEEIVIDTQLEMWDEVEDDIDVDSDGIQTHPDGSEEKH